LFQLQPINIRFSFIKAIEKEFTKRNIYLSILSIPSFIFIIRRPKYSFIPSKRPAQLQSQTNIQAVFSFFPCCIITKCSLTSLSLSIRFHYIRLLKAFSISEIVRVLSPVKHIRTNQFGLSSWKSYSKSPTLALNPYYLYWIPRSSIPIGARPIHIWKSSGYTWILDSIRVLMDELAH
jgi:hypothetical protein